MHRFMFHYHWCLVTILHSELVLEIPQNLDCQQDLDSQTLLDGIEHIIVSMLLYILFIFVSLSRLAA